jgi:hypothetical protein
MFSYQLKLQQFEINLNDRVFCKISLRHERESKYVLCIYFGLNGVQIKLKCVLLKSLVAFCEFSYDKRLAAHTQISALSRLP